MQRNLVVWLLIGAVCLVNSVNCQFLFVRAGGNTEDVEFRMPRLTSLIGRLSNTTFGLIRGGVTLFARTIDRIVNTFGRIEDRIRALLEELRKRILRGIPELNIPILDPLHINRVDFDVQQQSLRFKGHLENVTVKHISKFNVAELALKDLNGWNFRLDLNITFPFLKGTGMYDFDGLVGKNFHVFGNGPFWVNLMDLSVQTSTVIKFELTRLRVTDMKINIKLRKLENYFDNLLNDEETGQLINRMISKIAPEAIDLLWPEIRQPIEKQVVNYVNAILENTTVASVVRRLFNVV